MWPLKPNIQKMEKSGNVQGLIKVLSDKNWDLRLAATRALGRIGPSAVEPLCEALEDGEGYIYVRTHAADALGWIGDARAVEPLCQALGDWHADVRWAAAEALVKIGAPAVELLGEALKDPDWNMRRAAAHALEKIGLPPDPSVRAWYALAKRKPTSEGPRPRSLGSPLKGDYQMSNVPMTRPEEVLAIHEQSYGHSVTFVGLEDGRILESTGSEFLYSDDGGITWSEPYPALDENGEQLDGQCASLVNLAGGAIGLATLRYHSGVANHYETEMVFRTSENQGRNWSPPAVMNRSLLRTHALQDVMIRTASGRIILPVYFGIGQGSWHEEGKPFVGGYLNGNFVSTDAHFFDAHLCASYVLYSDDEGASWQPNSDGELFIVMDSGGPAEGAPEPSIVEVEPGKLMMIVRTGLGRLFQAWSEDNGETWSRLQPTQLAGTQAPGQLRKFPQTGHLLVVWTQQSEREIRQGFIRTRLSSAISRNGGGLWEHFQNIESLHEETHVEPGPIRRIRPEGCYGVHPGVAAPEVDNDYVVPLPEGYGRWSYPSVFVAEDRVLVFHTYSVHDSVTGEVINPGTSRLKVLPTSWFYGGGDPMRESMLIKKIEDQAPKP